MIDWLKRNRTSVRMAFLMRMVAMGLGVFLSLFWTRVLLQVMGDSAYGLFLSFQGVTRLGGLGDLGLSGAIALLASTMMGRGETDELRRLLSSGRTLFLLLAGSVSILFVAAAPWLPGWLGFKEMAGVGSLRLLFVCGGLSIGAFVIAGYFAALNYAYGTVTWPIFPALVIAQIIAPFLHWRLALLNAPLWVQYTPYVLTTVLGAIAAWLMLKWSHPWLGELRPLEVDRSRWKKLSSASGWAYLSSLGGVIYFATDRLVINGWFGPEPIPRYQANYKICELGITLAITASFVSLPKITHWLMSSETGDRVRLQTEVKRLTAFQLMLGCAIALGYLAFNDVFIRLWLGAAYHGPLTWQIAFAANLAITVAGDVGIQGNARCGKHGLRWSGLAVAGGGLLNLALSLVAVINGSLAGVAVATVAAQSILSLTSNWRFTRYAGISKVPWLIRIWALPLGTVLLAGLLRAQISLSTPAHYSVLMGAYVLLFIVLCYFAGMNWRTLNAELSLFRSMVKGR
jgi:O-antigen/teichoic acid export membrane protein